jgi:anti-sigma B factor antagonist
MAAATGMVMVQTVGNATYEVEEAGAVRLLRLALPDTLDTMEFDQLNEVLLGLIQGSAQFRWVMNLSRVSYMGSSMLGMLVNVRQKVKSERGQLVLCEMSPRLLQIFKACCLERLFNIQKTEADALRHVQ